MGYDIVRLSGILTCDPFRVDPNQLDQKMIEKIVSAHIGQTISLDDQHMQLLKFNGTDVNKFKILLAKIDKRGQITR